MYFCLPIDAIKSSLLKAFHPSKKRIVYKKNEYSKQF